MNRFFESPNSFASLLFYIFIIGSLDGCWDGGMSKYETLKNFEDPLIEPRHTTITYFITFTTACNRHHTMPYLSHITLSYFITFTTPQKSHTMKYLIIDTSPYNVMHATQHIIVQCMFLDTFLCVYLEFDFGPVLMVRNLYLTKPKYISNKNFLSA